MSFSKTNKSKLQHLTIEDIRKVKGYQDISDAEANRILQTLRQYVSLLVHFATQTDHL